MYHKNDHDSLSRCAQPLLKARVRIWGTGATAAAQSDPVAPELFSGRKVKALPLRPPVSGSLARTAQCCTQSPKDKADPTHPLGSFHTKCISTNSKLQK